MVGTYFSKEALHFRDINSDIYRLNDIKTNKRGISTGEYREAVRGRQELKRVPKEGTQSPPRRLSAPDHGSTCPTHRLCPSSPASPPQARAPALPSPQTPLPRPLGGSPRFRSLSSEVTRCEASLPAHHPLLYHPAS